MISKSICRIIGAFILLATASFTQAAPSIFDFRNQTSGIGLNLDNKSSGSATVDGITLTATLFPDGVFNQTASAFGINATNGSDDTDEFDPGEGFTFSFSTDVILNSLSVSNFGSTSSGLISFNIGSAIASITATGLTSLFSTFVSSGTVLRFESNSLDTTLTSSDFSFDSLSVTAVPEPATIPFFAGAIALGLVIARRRRPDQKLRSIATSSA